MNKKPKIVTDIGQHSRPMVPDPTNRFNIRDLINAAIDKHQAKPRMIGGQQWNPAANTVPLEIFDQGFKTVKAFNEALKEGKAEVKQGRLIVMGLERVGKTSTIKSFLKKEFNSEEPYTDGIATNKTYIQDSPDVWNEAPKDVSPFILIYEKEVEKKIKEQKVLRQEKPSSSSLSTSLSSPSKEEIPVGIASEAQTFGVKDETPTDFKIPENAFIMNIWDFGGQPIYSVIQRILFASFAVVCVVFNLEHDLDCRAWVRDPTTGEFYDHRMTYLDFIICCIRSVYMNGNTFELDGILGPPILLLGTHCNSLKLGMTENERKSKIKAISSKIWNALKNKPYEKMVFSDIFTIENSESFDKSGAADIMKEIFTLTKKMVKPLPLKWMLLLKKIQKLRKEHFCQNTNKIFKLMEQCGIKQDQHVVLQYLHNIGEIFYYPNDYALKDIIVIDIMQVVKLSVAIITIIKPEFQKPMLRSSWERLNTGILEKRLLIHVWEKFSVKDELVDFFASLLQRFGLICKKEVTEGQECVYYVLSRLKPVPDIPLPYDENRAISLFHDFSNYLPDHIFQRGVTKFIENFQMKNDNPKLHYEQVGLNIDKNHYVILNVVTNKQRRMFKTTIVRIGNPTIAKEVDPEPSVCKEVLDFLQEELTDLCPSDGEEVELKTYIHCTCCQDFHPVDDFNSDELVCGMKRMDMTRYHYLFGDGVPPTNGKLSVSAGVPEVTAHTAGAAGEPGEKYARLGEEASSSTRDLRAPVNASSQPTDRSGHKKHTFRNFLKKLSDQYSGNKYRWLRFLLYDHLPIAVLSKTDINGMFLFNELASTGHISSMDVTILSDIVGVTGLVAAKRCVEAYKLKETELNEGNGLTSFRKILFKGLMEVADTEVQGLVAYFNLSHFNFDNVWDLVFQLENQKNLDNKEKWIGFTGCVNEQAKSKIRDALRTMNQQQVAVMELGNNLKPTDATEARLEAAKKTQTKAAEAKSRVKEARKAAKKANEQAMKDKAAEREAKARAVEAEKQAVEFEEKARAARIAAREAKAKAESAEIESQKSGVMALAAKRVAKNAESISEEKAKLARKSETAAEKAEAVLKEAETLEEESMEKAAAALNFMLQNI